MGNGPIIGLTLASALNAVSYTDGLALVEVLLLFLSEFGICVVSEVGHRDLS